MTSIHIKTQAQYGMSLGIPEGFTYLSSNKICGERRLRWWGHVAGCRTKRSAPGYAVSLWSTLHTSWEHVDRLRKHLFRGCV